MIPRSATVLLPFLLSASLLNAQWTSLTGGGAVITSARSMVVVGTDLYAASYPNGVKKSTNGGTIWTSVNTGLPASGANVFCESVGWNGAFLFAGTQSGVYRSDDGGASWDPANGTLTASATVFANKWFHNGGVTMAIFSGAISAGGGIWRTTDNGSNWYIGHSGMGSNATVRSVTTIGTALWAATNVGIYTSNDNGLSWTAHPSVNYATYGIAEAGTNIAILSTFGYRYSTNGGSTWNDATGDPASPTEGELVAYDGILYANTGSDLLRSQDNGLTWSVYSTGIGAIDLPSLEEFVPAGTRLYVTAILDIYYISGIGTSMGDASARVSFDVFPCPAEAWITIVPPVGTRRIHVLDASGRRLLELAVAPGPVRMERGALTSGGYLLRAVDADGSVIGTRPVMFQ